MTEQPKIKLMEEKKIGLYTQSNALRCAGKEAYYYSKGLIDGARWARDECERRATEINYQICDELTKYIRSKTRLNKNATLSAIALVFQQYLKEQDGGE